MAQKKTIDDQSVLEKALLVISEHGPESFTLADVGRAVGLAPATLMQRFGSKQQLLILAAKQANVKLRGDLEELKKEKITLGSRTYSFTECRARRFWITSRHCQ